ncbi:TPA: hypothetical protein RQJ67_003516 [Vibrio vulnificus]|nr:hypothetical protein [Vibrio vulnificus]
MTWITLPSVSVQNGSKIVTVNNTQTTNIKVGDALLIGNYQPVEIAGVFATQLSLRTNWSNAAQANASAVVLPTFGDFNAATQALRQATQVTQGNFKTLEDWGTKLGNITFEGQDNSKHTARTLLQMDADVTEAVEKIPAQMAEEMSLQMRHLFRPDWSWSAVNGLEAQGGSLSFSRASKAWHIDKAGVLCEVEPDTPSIGIDGLEVYSARTNLISHSFSKIGWGDSNNTLVAVDSDEIGPDLINTVWQTREANENSMRRIYVVVGIADGKESHFSIMVKSVGYNKVMLRNSSGNQGAPVFNLETGEIEYSPNNKYFNVALKKLCKNYYQMSVSSSSSNGVWWIQPLSATDGADIFYPSEERTLYVAHSQIAEDSAPAPIIRTSGVQLSRNSEFITASRGIMPPPGNDFTLITKVYIERGKALSTLLSDLRYAETNAFAIFLNNHNDTHPLFVWSNGQNKVSLSATAGVGEHTLAVRYFNSELSVFVDGEKRKTYTTAISYQAYENWRIGHLSSNPYSANSPIQYLDVYHRALTDEQIKILGAI